MEVVDLSQALWSDMPVYHGDAQFQCTSTFLLPGGITTQYIGCSSHHGTHIDAPYHFFEDGETVEQLPLSDLIGPVIVVDVTDKAPRQRIMWSDIEHYEERIRLGASQGALVFFRTGWSKYWLSQEYSGHPFLDKGIAEKLIEFGIQVMGIDTFSPDETPVYDLGGTTKDYGVHQTFLGAGAIIAENLTNLEAIQDGDWTVCLAPLKILGCDASPVRAMAWKRGTA
ncbi:hypothetical protein EW026_g3753 [Hermanssonia centrifuga]|uniref:Cyclase n=1 Tax=Hermanssonia centrifuga TaxID=98765 RepID=A0A4S4KJ78_9APHY|nr:hypothetical protein EW026_g3753 [Hermanssonia centrifuga]